MPGMGYFLLTTHGVFYVPTVDVPAPQQRIERSLQSETQVDTHTKGKIFYPNHKKKTRNRSRKSGTQVDTQTKSQKVYHFPLLQTYDKFDIFGPLDKIPSVEIVEIGKCQYLDMEGTPQTYTPSQNIETLQKKEKKTLTFQLQTDTSRLVILSRHPGKPTVVEKFKTTIKLHDLFQRNDISPNLYGFGIESLPSLASSQPDPVPSSQPPKNMFLSKMIMERFQGDCTLNAKLVRSCLGYASTKYMFDFFDKVNTLIMRVASLGFMLTDLKLNNIVYKNICRGYNTHDGCKNPNCKDFHEPCCKVKHEIVSSEHYVVYKLIDFDVNWVFHSLIVDNSEKGWKSKFFMSLYMWNCILYQSYRFFLFLKNSDISLPLETLLYHSYRQEIVNLKHDPDTIFGEFINNMYKNSTMKHYEKMMSYMNNRHREPYTYGNKFVDIIKTRLQRALGDDPYLEGQTIKEELYTKLFPLVESSFSNQKFTILNDNDLKYWKTLVNGYIKTWERDIFIDEKEHVHEKNEVKDRNKNISSLAQRMVEHRIAIYSQHVQNWNFVTHKKHLFLKRQNEWYKHIHVCRYWSPETKMTLIDMQISVLNNSQVLKDTRTHVTSVNSDLVRTTTGQ
jgi:hypothetical protein